MSRIYVFLWLIILGISLFLNSWLPIIMIILPPFYGNSILMICGMTQHAGLADNVKDHRKRVNGLSMTPMVLPNPLSLVLVVSSAVLHYSVSQQRLGHCFRFVHFVWVKTSSEWGDQFLRAERYLLVHPNHSYTQRWSSRRWRALEVFAPPFFVTIV